jgi:aspartyl-tRNA(Asn)/glutamyl-tRNA(Gln) amidotransferase subunit A
MTGWTLAEVAEAIRSRRISSLEATDACLRQLKRLQPALRCCIRIDAEDARRSAGEADRRLARGDRVGRLHGVPLAHKDVFDRAGKSTSCGSKIRAHHIASSTADVLQRLDRAGAIDLGRLNMAEFAAGGTGHNVHWGDCVNPWNPAYTPGGSSSGSAAAVAARAIFGSLGTDTGGSLRWPAALCGVTAIRPTPGRASLGGVAPRAWSLDAVGPIARTAEDCALLLAVICDGLEPLEQSAKGLRIGVPGGRWRADLTEEQNRALESALSVFRSLGSDIVHVDLPDPEITFRLGDLIVKAEASSLHGRWLRERPHDYAPGIRAQLESGLAISAAQYLDALRLRAPLLREFLSAGFARADVLYVAAHPYAAPTMADCAPRSAEAVAAFWAAYPRLTRPFSYLGLPALALPCGMASSGIPVGSQLVGRPFGESSLLTLAHLFQKETDWHRRAPSLAGSS